MPEKRKVHEPQDCSHQKADSPFCLRKSSAGRHFTGYRFPFPALLRVQAFEFVRSSACRLQHNHIFAQIRAVSGNNIMMRILQRTFLFHIKSTLSFVS